MAHQAKCTYQAWPHLGHWGYPSAFGNGQQLDDITPVVELHVIVTADNNIGKGIITGVEGQSKGRKALHATSMTVVVDLDEVIGISGFLAGALQMGLANNFDFRFLSLFFLFMYVRYKKSKLEALMETSNLILLLAIPENARKNP